MEKKKLITTFFIDEKIDCGKIILQKRLGYQKTQLKTQLHNILMNKGSDLLENTINLIEQNKVNSINQKQENKLKSFLN